MSEDIRPFPIQGDLYRDIEGIIHKKSCTIPWWLAEIAYEYYSSLYGKGQSLERLAERGGFGRLELVRFIRKDVEGKMEDKDE